MRKIDKERSLAKYAYIPGMTLMLLMLPHIRVHAEDVFKEGGYCGPDAKYMGYDTDGDGVADKLVISGQGVMWDWSIQNHLWRGDTGTKLEVRTVVIEDGITRIGANESGAVEPQGAFRDFTHLTSITIPDSVTVIGENSFSNCGSLTGIDIPETVTRIKFGAFQDCSRLTDIAIPYGVTALENDLFNGCSSLTELTIPDSVASIGEHAFDSAGLTDITIPGTVTSIGNDAFRNCVNLNHVTIPASVVSIGDHAFEYCPELKSVTIPNNACSIGEQAFGLLCQPSLPWPDDGTEDVRGFVDGFTIYGHTGSEAERYVRELTEDYKTDKMMFIPLKSNWQGPYWYEDGVKQGVRYNEDGTIDLSYRGKEIFDPSTNAWYWLDSVQDGAVARSKDVYQESAAGEWADSPDGTGKWVRYDEDGHMVKGWDENEKGRFYFDLQYGAMAKGYVTIGDIEYYFNRETGVCERSMPVPEYGFAEIDGKTVMFEKYKRQGYNAHNPEYRGKEVYSHYYGAWIWLDNTNDGAVAKSKDVYHPAAEGSEGKWVRYDGKGYMMKGWVIGTGADAIKMEPTHSMEEALRSYLSEGKSVYYFDYTTGAMQKGDFTTEGVTYHFDEGTGMLQMP